MLHHRLCICLALLDSPEQLYEVIGLIATFPEMYESSSCSALCQQLVLSVFFFYYYLKHSTSVCLYHIVILMGCPLSITKVSSFSYAYWKLGHLIL